MRRVVYALVMIFCSTSFLTLSQNKVIDPTDYDGWNSIYQQQISDNGNCVSYQIKPHRGDGKLFLHQQNGKNDISFERGKDAVFSGNQEVLLFKIHPGYDTIRELKLEKVKKEKRVQDSLGMYWIQKDSLMKVANLVDVKAAKENDFFAYRILKDSIKPTPKKKKGWFRKKKEKEKVETDGNPLFLVHAKNDSTTILERVTEYEFNAAGTHLFYATHLKCKEKEHHRVHLYDLENGKTVEWDSSFTEKPSFSFSKKGNVLAFIATADTAKDTKLYDIYTWDINDTFPHLTLSKSDSLNFENRTLSPKRNLSFSLDESKLFFGLGEYPEEKKKDTLLKSEKAELDVWNYKDKRLQPQQLKELKRDEDRTYLSVFDRSSNTFQIIDNDTLFATILNQGNSNFALGTSTERYQRSYNWSYPWKKDYYLIDVRTGNQQIIKEGLDYSEGLSPQGKHFIYYDSPNNDYYSMNMEKGTEHCMTCDFSDSILWQEDINGMPFEANPVGIAGYLSEDEVLIHSQFNVWKYNFNTQELRGITPAIAAENKTKYRLVNLNQDSTYLQLDEVLVKGIDQETMDESIYQVDASENTIKLKKIYGSNHWIYGFQKAKKSNQFIFRKMNVEDYPELYVTNASFSSVEKLTNANPQQGDYNWATVETVNWKSYRGDSLKGLIYKPTDFDTTKKYPLLIYYYELNSHNKHRHYIPRPTASIIFPTEYASAGYVVFIPDIRYESGYPAQSTYDCVMSGTDKVLELYPNIDSTKMGLQGQSWGGYATAQLITMTDRYAAGMAGAPVANMFSAYGGVRWASGLNRAFQYEHTQSRIGKTIWEAPALYVENSPLFGVPNIKTPLLIMHNDNDGAVPWYQGIELFTAMKRLDKPVWMLQYNGEEHNLMQNKNRMDLSIRMRQFFDYFLQDKPAPKWLENGVPAIQKGKDFGLE